MICIKFLLSPENHYNYLTIKTWQNTQNRQKTENSKNSLRVKERRNLQKLQ